MKSTYFLISFDSYHLYQNISKRIPTKILQDIDRHEQTCEHINRCIFNLCNYIARVKIAISYKGLIIHIIRIISRLEGKIQQTKIIMKTHKVGQDIIFTERQLTHFTGGMPKAVWVLAVLTLSFFMTESLLMFVGK